MVLEIGEFFTRSKSWANALQDKNNHGWANNLQGIHFVFFERHKFIHKRLLYKKQVKYIIGLSKILFCFVQKLKFDQ